jgi:hypothetical protein
LRIFRWQRTATRRTKKRFHPLNALAVRSFFVLGMFSRVASSHQPATAPCTCFNASLAFGLHLIA